MSALLYDAKTPYYANWSPEDGEWVGTCPEFPSLSWLDPKPSVALDGIKNVVAEVRDDLADERSSNGCHS